MRVLVALDSFKGTLSAAEACDVAAEAMREIYPEWRVSVLPMADGGEGTVDALVAACDGRWVPVEDVMGPLPQMRVPAGFGWLPRSRTAVVEMACASGLPLLRKEDRNPLLTTTYGTGELLKAAIGMEPRKILLTLGGSATVDGGTGACRALGWRFLDAQGMETAEGGEGLSQITHIEMPLASARQMPEIKALCDVDNPLCGARGAAAIYGPQKGADSAMVTRLEHGLKNLAFCIKRDLSKDVLDLPGAGAAGGFGAGAVAFLNADLVPGVEAVAEACDLGSMLESCDWVVTGEGMFDAQSLQGKVVSGVRNYAVAKDVRVAVLAGRVRLSPAECQREGISVARACAAATVSDREAFAHARSLLHSAAHNLAVTIAERIV